MNRYLALLLFTITALSLSDVRAQHSLQLDPGNGNYITISAPPGLNPSYTWVLPLNPPPSNTAFTEGGSVEGQTLRWNGTLSYYVPTSALLIESSGAMTLNPGEGNNITLTNIPTDNSAALFLTVNDLNQVRMRTLGSILGVTANEGLVYDEPNIKLGAGDANTNPFLSDRYVNIGDNLLSFTSGGQSSDLLVLDGSTGSVDINGDLKAAGNAGTSGQLLKSNGVGATPEWTDVTESAWGITGNDNIDSNIHYIGTNEGNNQSIVFKTNGVKRAMFLGSTDGEDEGAFIPYLDNTYQLGSENHRWIDLYVGPGSIKIGGFINGAKGSQSQQTVDQVTLSYADGNLVIDKPVANFGSMVPNTNNILELGSSSNRWKDIWLGPNSIHIGSPSYEGSISYDPTAKELKFNSNNTIGSSELRIDSLGYLTVASLGAGGLLKANVGGMITLATGGADFESPLTFSNGLTRTVNNVTLGGALGANTTLTTGAYTLSFTTLGGNVSIASTGQLSTPSIAVGSSSSFTVNSLGAIASATGITSSGAVTFSGLTTGIVHSTAGVLSSSAVNLAGGATEISGQLGVANGGTGRSSVTAQALLVGNGTSAMNELAIGGANTILGVSGGAPAWVTLATNATLVGDGRGTSFGLNLSNANSWTALQTFSNGASVSGGLTIPAGANPMSVNGSTGAADELLTSQGANSPEWKSLTTLGISTGTGTSGSVTMWNSSNVLGDAPIIINDGAIELDGSVNIIDLSTGVVHADLNGELSSSAVDLSTEVTDVLPTGNGGTGLSSVGTDGTVLTVVTGAPAWQALSTGATLSGNGTTTPFAINLGNSNTWSGPQTFTGGVSISGGLTISPGANPMSFNGSNGTADQVLTSQGSNTPEWKSLSTLGVLTGTGASNKLAYWSGTSTLTNDADLGYDGTTLSMAGSTDNISVGQSTSGGTNVRINIKDGHLRSQQTTVPTAVAEANAGNNGSVTLTNATDVAGKLRVHTQNPSIAAGLQATVTFNAVYNVAPIVVITPANANASDIQAYVSTSTTGFTVSFNVAGGNNDDHDFYYHVIETQ
jgi:hypothetical protein